MKVAISQMKPYLADVEKNLKKMEENIEKAIKNEAMKGSTFTFGTIFSGVLYQIFNNNKKKIERRKHFIDSTHRNICYSSFIYRAFSWAESSRCS